MSESPRAQQVTRHLTWTLGWGGGGQRGSWVPEGGHSPKGGQSRNAAFGSGGFIGNLRQPWLYGGEETGLAEFPCQLKGRQGAGRGHGQTEP